MEAVATTARGRVVNGQMQVVAPEEPFERAPRFLAPARVVADAVRLEARRHHGLRFHGLLIKARAFAAARIKTVGADGDKMMAGPVGALDPRQPVERFQA